MSTTTIMYANFAGSNHHRDGRNRPGAAADVTLPSLVRRAVVRVGGRVTRARSDIAVAEFDSTYDAVRAAVAIQQDIARNHGHHALDAPRIGIDVAEIIGEDVEAFGAAAGVARRICDAAEPGQILVSDVVEYLLRRRHDIAFDPAGGIDVDGANEGQSVYQVAWEADVVPPITRTVVADDAGLLRAGIVNLLAANSFDVVAEAADFDSVIEAVERHRPDLLITDIRMPPTNTDEGVRAALALWPTNPELAVLVLSQYVEARAAVELLDGAPVGVGYLLKERVTEVSEFVDSARSVLAGQAIIDPTVAERMMARRSVSAALTRLSGREQEVLARMATGASNSAIATSLFVSPKTVETHVSSILTKLDLPDVPEGNRRVQAVLRFLEATR